MTYRGDPDESDRDLRQTTDRQLEGTYSSLGPPISAVMCWVGC